MTNPGDEGRRLWARHAAETAGVESCPGLLDLAAFVEGRLPNAERALVEGHLAGCARCLALVLAQRGRGAIVATPSPALVARARSAVGLAPPAAPAWRWAGLAAGLAAVVVLTSRLGFEAGHRAAASERRVARAIAAELTFGLSAELRREATPPAGFLPLEEERP